MSDGLEDDVSPALMREVGLPLADVERTLILDTLIYCGGNRTHAADMLGIAIRTLRNKLHQYTAEGRAVPPPPSPANEKRAA